MNPAEATRFKHQEYRPSREQWRTSLDGHLRSKSEGNRRYRRRHNVTRHSSTDSSATSLDVRCACQYFQGDALFPATQRESPTRKQRTNLFTEKKVVFNIRYVTDVRMYVMFEQNQKWDKKEIKTSYILLGFCVSHDVDYT